MKERLQKILARAGISSRRKAEELILEGRVTINGSVVLELGTKADPTHDVISLDNMVIAAAENKVYVMLNKPPGYITSLSDPEGRPTVMNIVNRIPERIVPVGRLDYETEGLLILTNDGDFSQLLQHPRFQIERCYRVKVKGMPSPVVIEKLKNGVYIDNVKTNKCGIKLLDRLDKNTWLEVRLKEGRNRQIRKMFEVVGYAAIRIIRISFGPLELGALPVGSFRFLSKKEIDMIKDLEKISIEKPPRKAFSKPRRKPSEESSGKPAGWAIGKPGAKPARKSVERSSGKPGGRPVERSFGKPGARPAKRASGKPGERSVERSFGKPGAKPAARSSGKPGGRPAGRSFGKPGARPSERSSGKSGGKPVGRSLGRTSDKPAGKPVRKPQRSKAT